METSMAATTEFADSKTPGFEDGVKVTKARGPALGREWQGENLIRTTGGFFLGFPAKLVHD